MASELLRKKGYSILAENWRSSRNELDIVAKIGTTIVFVEVKTRRSDYFGDPSKAVSLAKQKRLILAANSYMEQNEIDLEARFDVISIVSNANGTRLEHSEDAFYPLA